MEYTIQKLAQLSGVSPRTLRYYHEIGLLVPKRLSSSGYRIYGAAEVDRLQQILYLKRFGIKLEEIKQTLTDPTFDIRPLLTQQRHYLSQELSQLQELIHHLDQTLAYYEGGTTMRDQDKFSAFKQRKLHENEMKYGAEIREKYGEETVEKANQKWQQLTQADYQKMQAAEQRLFNALETLSQDLTTVDLDSQLAHEAFLAHREWLTITAPFYHEAYHRGLADMYLADERFAAYYNQKTSHPSAQLLHDIIYHYTAE